MGALFPRNENLRKGIADTTLSLQVNLPSQAMTFQDDIPVPILCASNPRTVTWERLESLRLQRLGLNNSYSRHFEAVRNSAGAEEMEAELKIEDKLATAGMCPGLARQSSQPAMPGRSCSVSNSMAPFSTLGKPTCGYFFNRGTDNKKRKFGIPPSNVMQWRNFSAQNAAQ